MASVTVSICRSTIHESLILFLSNPATGFAILRVATNYVHTLYDLNPEPVQHIPYLALRRYGVLRIALKNILGWLRLGL